MVFNGLPSMRARAEESERLLEWGFREFENVVLFRAADVIKEVPVDLGDRPTVPLVDQDGWSPCRGNGGRNCRCGCATMHRWPRR